MTRYCTLNEAQTELKAAPDAAGDARLLDYIDIVSRRIDMLFAQGRRPYFAPWQGELSRRVHPRYIDSREGTINLGNWLLEFSAVTLNSSAITTVVQTWPDSHKPVKHLQWTDNCRRTWYEQCSDCQTRYVKVTGTWGMNRDYDNAWLKYDDVTDGGGINATVTTITVADADGKDPFGDVPRFSAGQLIRVDDEYMDVLDTNATANTLTVLRGVNGTTAAAHANGADIDVYQVDHIVRRATARQAAMLVARRGAFQQEEFDGARVTSYPPDLLTELADIVMAYQYMETQ